MDLKAMTDFLDVCDAMVRFLRQEKWAVLPINLGLGPCNVVIDQRNNQVKGQLSKHQNFG